MCRYAFTETQSLYSMFEKGLKAFIFILQCKNGMYFRLFVRLDCTYFEIFHETTVVEESKVFESSACVQHPY